jgi:hypothetical protein
MGDRLNWISRKKAQKAQNKIHIKNHFVLFVPFCG